MAISEITLLELATFVTKGPIRLESFLQEVESQFVVLPISGQGCARAMGLRATYPKDPADRTVAATALARGAMVAYRRPRDPQSRAVHTIW